MKLKHLLSLSILLLLIISVSPLFAITLSWDIAKDERLEIVRTANVGYYINQALDKTYEERNIIDLTCYEKSEEGMKVKGIFSVFKKNAGESVFHLEKRSFSDFVIAPDGHMTVPDKYLFPNVRNLPTFPDKDLEIGETWVMPAEIIFDELSAPLAMKFYVDYTLNEIREIEGKKIAVISYKTEYEKNLDTDTRPADYPLAFGSRTSGTIFWDIEGKRPFDETVIDKFIVLHPDGETYTQDDAKISSQFKIYKPVLKDEIEKSKEALKKELGGNEGISVDSNDRGLIVRMGEILFDFDSAKLKSSAQKTLDVVISALKKDYPDREISVEGYTDSTGDPQYNMNLSDRRAETVAEYIGKGIDHDKLSYKGFGAENPIGDNATKEGRQKNRRVEILIKLK